MFTTKANEMTDRTDFELKRDISSWGVVNKNVPMFTENDCRNALNVEIVGKRRKDIVLRIHQRYCSLRKDRERAELMTAIEDTPKFLTPVFNGE
jgi:hypothetical protein